MSRILVFFISLFLMTAVLTSCEKIDDSRIPPVNVNLTFTSGEWATYGVGGALEHKRFINSRTNIVPSNFPYKVTSYTGYGGILLIGNLYGFPMAYDLSCPYEAKPDIRVEIDDRTHDAVCPKCGSVYDVFGGDGRPTGGPSAEYGYGMTRYKVLEGNDALNYRLITR